MEPKPKPKPTLGLFDELKIKCQLEFCLTLIMNQQ